MSKEVLLKLDEKGVGSFYIMDHQKEIGHIDIKISGNTLMAIHTEVNPAYEGNGLAKSMFLEMIGYSRKNQLKVKALCSYVDLQFKKNPEEYSDLIN